MNCLFTARGRKVRSFRTGLSFLTLAQSPDTGLPGVLIIALFMIAFVYYCTFVEVCDRCSCDE
jgi:hypothetical protein